MNAHDPILAARRLAPLREFIIEVTRIAGRDMPEPERVAAVREHLARLIAQDDWLPEEAAQPHPQFYQQYLLHCDPLSRFSVVSFVWGPGQHTPVHDHMVWGLVGMLRGAETSQAYGRDAQGRVVPQGPLERLEPGDIAMVSPATGDIHLVSNAFEDRASISIHVYGGNIGATSRHVFEAGTDIVKPFVSGYSSTQIPNLWDLSPLVREQITGPAASAAPQGQARGSA